MVNMILALLGIGSRYLEKRQELKLRELEAESAAKVKRMDNASDWEGIAAQRSSRLLRWVLALHLLAGMNATIYLAVTGSKNPQIIFQALEYLPNWYAGLLMTMFSWAFASAPLKAAGGKLASSWRNKKAKKSVADMVKAESNESVKEQSKDIGFFKQGD